MKRPFICILIIFKLLCYVSLPCKLKFWRTLKFGNYWQFLNQVPVGLRFLEIAFVREVGMRVSVSVCVRPQAIKNYSREIKSE